MIPQWYLLQVESKREKTTQAALARAVNANGLEDEIIQLVVPTHSEVKQRHNRKTTKEVVSFPGYLMAKVALNDELERLITAVPGVIGFISDRVSDANRPQPLPMSDQDARVFLDSDITTIDPGVAPGDAVEITSGPMTSMRGYVRYLSPTDGRIIVDVSIFGRSTPIEVNATDVLRV